MTQQKTTLAEQMTVTASTRHWAETLYEAGAITYEKDRAVVLHPRIRELVQAMHAVLAGGKIDLKVTSTGGAMYNTLERQFETMWTETAQEYVDSAGKPTAIFP